MRAHSVLLRALYLVPPALPLVIAILTPTEALYPHQTDVQLYLEKARALVTGQGVVADLIREYPPAALIPMVVPFLAGLSRDLGLDGYKFLFAAWEAVLLVALGRVLVRIASHLGGTTARDTVVRLATLVPAAALVLTWRYDLFPAVLTAVAVLAAIERRPTVLGFALGIGVLAKLYPLALLPALATPWLLPPDRRQLVRLASSLVATVVLGTLPFVAAAGTEAFGFLGFQLGRGLQIESLGGGATVLAGLLTGDAPGLSFGYSAVQVEGSMAQAWLIVLPLMAVAGLASLVWLGRRRILSEAGLDGRALGCRPETIVDLAYASLVVLLVTSRVFSIQYVVWLLPFIVLSRGPRFWLGAAVLALTIPIHPILYADLIRQSALPILVLSVRNAVVACLAVLLLRDIATIRRLSG